VPGDSTPGQPGPWLRGVEHRYQSIPTVKTTVSAQAGKWTSPAPRGWTYDHCLSSLRAAGTPLVISSLHTSERVVNAFS